MGTCVSTENVVHPSTENEIISNIEAPVLEEDLFSSRPPSQVSRIFCTQNRESLLPAVDHLVVVDIENLDEDRLDITEVPVIELDSSFCHPPSQHSQQLREPIIPSEDHLDTGPIQDDVNHLEATCQETAPMLVSIHKEERDEIQAILLEWESEGRLRSIINYTRHALSREILESLTTLANYLTESTASYLEDLADKSPHYSVLAKAFAIYAWICYESMPFDTELWEQYLYEKKLFTVSEYFEGMTAKDAFTAKKAVCVGYSVLFAELATLAGIRAEVITGEISHVPNPALSADEARTSTAVSHTWNVFDVEGVWVPVDCTFGANYRDKSMKFQPNYTRHFFAATPSTFILTHWPDTKDWQLLETSVEREALDPLVILPSCAAGRGTRPLTWKRSIVVSEDQHSTVIELTAKPSLRIGAKLLYKQGGTVYVVMDKKHILIQRNEDVVYIHAAFPCKGVYSLLITINPANTGKGQVTQVFLSYHIMCMSETSREISYPKVYPFPASKYNFRFLFWNQSRPDCVCESNFDRLNLAFKANRGMTFSHFLIRGKTRDSRPQDHSVVYNYNTMVVTEIDTADEKLSLHMLKVVFPMKGWWTICLLGTTFNPDLEIQRGYVTLMSYHVYAHEQDSISTFPRIISPQVSACCFDLISSVSESIDILFTTTKPLVEFQAYLMEKKPNAPELESYVRVELVSLDANQYKLIAMFPKPGHWYVHVFGRPEEEFLPEEVEEDCSEAVEADRPEAVEENRPEAVEENRPEAVEEDRPEEVEEDRPEAVEEDLSQENPPDEDDPDKPRKIPGDNPHCGLFSLLVNVKTPMQGALSVIRSSNQVSFQNKEYITFPDNGKPLRIDFDSDKDAPFRHRVIPEDRDENILKEYEGLSLLEHCTYLAPLRPAEASIPLSIVRPILRSLRSVTQQVLPYHQLKGTTSTYRVYASFPWPGIWNVAVFAPTPGSADYSLAFHVTVEVTKPSRGVCYPFIYEEFIQLGMRIPIESICYNPISTESADFELPFNAPDNIQFTWNIEVAGSDNCYKKQGFVHQLGNRSSSHIFRLSFSTPGIWRAVLFAKKFTTPEEDIYKHILEISLLVNTVDRDVAFPEIFPAFKKYGLSIARVDLPFLSRVQDTPITVVLPLYCQDYVKFFHRFDCAEKTEEKKMLLPQTQMLQYPDLESARYEIRIEIAEPGTYKIQLGAQWMDCEENDYEPVLTHVITCTTEN